MSQENPPSAYPPPTIPPPPPRRLRSSSPKIRGSYVVLGGIIFAFLPLLITLVASIFIDDAFNEGTSTLGTLPWLTILTMPIGGLVALIGLIIGAGNLGKRKKTAE